jgi:hypothetical protein
VSWHGLCTFISGYTETTALKLHNHPTFLQDLDIGGGDIIDIGTIDIFRDRERGIPRYNEFHQCLALKPVDTFETLTGGDQALAAEIASVYNNDIEMLNLQVGMAAEGIRPQCYGFGETAFQVFIINALYHLQKDQFYTDDYRPEIYTQEGIDWIEGNTMKSVILRHFPELENTDIAYVDNAFVPLLSSA